MKILLTGASPRAFIGQHLLRGLAQRYEVYAPNRATLELTDSDSVNAFFSKHTFDAVIHAAVHGEGKAEEVQQDLKMFYHLLHNKQSFGKLIYFGSGAEYDKSRPLDMAREDQIGVRIPAAPYGFSKYVMNHIARSRKDIINLRLFGVYGPGEDWRRKFISGLCYKAVFGLPLTVRQDCMFDFLWAEDIVPAVAWAIENETKYADYNLCSGQAVSLVAVAEMVKKVAGKNLAIEVLQEGWGRAYTGDASRMQGEAGWRATQLAEGVEHLYRFFEKNQKEEDFLILQSVK